MKIDGKVIASKILEDLKNKVQELNVIPHLAIILIDKDPASVAYVNQKEIKGKKIGAKISVRNLPKNVQKDKLLAIIQSLNDDHNVHGVIVQRPLPPQIDSNKISQAIDPKKDVDGFHPNSKFRPPIALAVLRILEEVFVTPRMVARQRPRLLRGGFLKWLKSQKIVVLGKGETGGKSIIEMFRKMNIQPEVIDSKTENPETIIKKADVIISAVGKPNAVKPEMLKKDVILIGVGLHRGGDGKFHGDYDEEKIKKIASFYTPTPGGVGPLNVAMLLKNLVTAAQN